MSKLAKAKHDGRGRPKGEEKVNIHLRTSQDMAEDLDLLRVDLGFRSRQEVVSFLLREEIKKRIKKIKV